MSSISKFLKGSLILSVASIVVRLSGILVLIPLARLLGPTQLGIYSLIFQLVQSGTMLGRLGVDAAMHRNGAQSYQIDRVATGRLLGVGITLMIVSFTLLTASVWIWRLPLAEHWLGSKEAVNSLGYGSLILFSEGIGIVFLTGLLSLHNFKANSFATAISALGKLLLSPILAWRYGLSGAFLGLLLASLLQLGVAAIAFFQTMQSHKIPLILEGFLPEAEKIFKFGLPFYSGNALIGFVMLPMMGQLGVIAGVETLGKLRIAQSLSQIVNFLPGAIAPVAISTLSEAYTAKDNNQDFQRLRSMHLRGNWLISLFFVLLLGLTSNALISLLFGVAYQAATPLVIGMGFVALLTVVVENLNLYSLSAGNTVAIAIGSIIQKVSFIGLTFCLIPHLKGIGFVLGLLIGGCLQLVIMQIFLWQSWEKLLKQKVLHLSLWSVFVLALISLVNLYNQPILVELIMGVSMTSIVIIPIVFSTLSLEEKEYIRRLKIK